MQFHLDLDKGNYLSGWVLPDNPSATPSVVVLSPNAEPLTVKAGVFRKDLFKLGLHHTGLLGFEIDQTVIPQLSATDRIEIRDADTNILIYRRFRDGEHVRLKLFRYELGSMPQVQLDLTLGQHFTLTYEAIERYSFDTSWGIFNNATNTSVYLSGRPQLTRYMQVLRDRNFKTVVVLRNPMEELAEKILFLKFAISGKAPDFVANHLTGMEAVLPLVSRMNLADDNSLVTTMNGLSEAEHTALSNPFVRLLACARDEVAQDLHVSVALENLANLDLVGVRPKFESFKQELATALGVDLIGREAPAAISNAPAVAEKLARLRSVHRLLALDLKLYHLVEEAVSKVETRALQPR
jgi:hypothetical protein